jgi:putative ABC transport system permease protein
MSRLPLARELHPLVSAMRTFFQDFRFALRVLTGNMGTAAVAALTLALGIASTATVFSWIDALLLHPFPGTARSEQLAVLEMSIPSAPNGGTSVSWLDYTDYRDHLKLVQGLTLQRYGSMSIGEAEGARLAWGEMVSASYFEVLGVQPLLGRMFTSGGRGDTPGAYPVTVISERLWRSYFHSDPGVIGQTLRVDRVPMTVLGVAPAVFRGTSPGMLLDLWVPASMGVQLGLAGDAMFKDRNYRDFSSMVVRLKPGVSMAAARNEASALAAGLARVYPNTNRGVSATILPPWLAHSGTGDLLLSPLRILMVVSLVLLLIVCANVANLLLARSVIRQREFGVRIALGASRWRVVRQLLTETLLLSALGTLAGVLLVSWMWSALLVLIPDVGLPIARDFALNGRIVAYTALCCLFCTLISGAAPALFSARTSLNEVLKEGGRSGSTGTATHRTRSLLVIAEVALAAIALVGAGLFARSFRNISQMHPGFDSGNVLFGRFFMDGTGFSGEQQRQFALRLRRNLEGQPGIQSVSYSDFVPLAATAGAYDRVEPEGYVRAAGESLNVNRARVAPGYFALMHIPLLAGRDFAETDDSKAAPVLIVNQAFSRRYFHAENPVGRRVKLFGKWMAVVGLARDGKYFSPAEAPRPYFYLPFLQMQYQLRELDYFVRTAGDPVQAIPTLRRAVMATDPAASSFHPVALSEYITVALFPQKVAASLMAALGAMCLFLAALGLFSVMSCAVNQRAQEIGLRMAMGARPSDVIGMVVRQGMALVLAGLVVGIGLAFALARLISGMLIHVSATDPLTFGGAALFLALVALAATWLPAQRATLVNPMIALRQR